jgi:cephalosporin hydroxylase
MIVDINSSSAAWRDDLVRDIRYHDHRDDLDWNGGSFAEVPDRFIEVRHPHHGYIVTMTPCNLHAIAEQYNLIKHHCKAILEIGVNHNATPTDMTSTSFFIKNKNSDTVYLGVDINDKSYLSSHDKNIHMLQADSGNVSSVMHYAHSLGIYQFDFIFIDGWHSINQVMREWEYSKYLSNDGIMGFHDTAVHPGPNLFLRNLNQSKWKVLENCCGFDQNDFGVGFAWKRR